MKLFCNSYIANIQKCKLRQIEERILLKNREMPTKYLKGEESH